MPNLKNSHGLQMDSTELLALFGLKNNKIPADFYHPGKMIDNVLVSIAKSENKGRGSKHRVLATCPICEKRVDAGHLHQHLKSHRSKP